jgi:pyruvate/2-oxoacid:ferredoxin oxidoreductase beta subunit
MGAYGTFCSGATLKAIAEGWGKQIHSKGDGATNDIGFQILKAAIMRTSSFVEMNEYLNQK